MLKKLSEWLHSLTNAKEPPKPAYSEEDIIQEEQLRKDEIIKREKVEGTPFHIIQTQGKTFIALGMYKVSQDLTYKECREAIKTRDWGLMMNVARLITIDEINIDKATLNEQDPKSKKDNKHLTKTN